MSAVYLSFPDIDVECPACGEIQCLSGFDFETTSDYEAFAKLPDVFCEHCEHEFDVVVGGES